MDEIALILPFLKAARRARWSQILSKPKKRSRFIEALSSFGDFDPRWMSEIPAARQDSSCIRELFLTRGAPEFCYVFSENAEVDGQELPLKESLDRVVGFRFGSIISCIPGRLAYYEGELPGCHVILERP